MKNITAATVRAYFRADAKRLDRLSETAAVTVAEGARGRLHPEVIKVYNRNRKEANRYVLGADKVAKETRAAQREALREAGVEVGARGRLSAAAKEVLAQSKG